jgi:hypothetical protein
MFTTLIPRGYEQEVANRVTFMPRYACLVKGLYNVPIAEGVTTLEDAERALAELGYVRSHEWREEMCGSFRTDVVRTGCLFPYVATSVAGEAKD